MRSTRWLLVLPLLALAAWSRPPEHRAQGPSLLVLISVDQLRTDLLQRYDRYFTGGLRRLLDEGASFAAVHDHAESETAPGHATISTGAVPARHGIVANEWSEWIGGRWVSVYNTADSLSPVVGHPSLPGRSPRNLLRPGVADWLRAAHPQAQVVSIAGKDRSAILLAGRARGDVYWYHHDLGRFVTTAHYTDAEPGWVAAFNAGALPALFDSVWVESSPRAARALARPDTAAYEGDGVHSYFPHRFSLEKGRYGGSFSRWVGGTPQVDRAVLALAREAIRERGLGRDAAPDFLALGLAQSDYVGHSYGPLSREQLDNLIRLDRELGAFFAHLDRTVGRGRWVAALSADHGATDMPEWSSSRGQPGVRITREQRDRLVAAVRRAAESAPSGQGAQAGARAAEGFPFVADAYTLAEIARGAPRDSFVSLFRNSYYPGRVPSDVGRYSVEVRYTPGSYASWGPTGTGHGSPYFYDRSVPVILLGGGVAPGPRSDIVRTVDVAPTLATLAGLPVPADLDGRVLEVRRR